MRVLFLLLLLSAFLFSLDVSGKLEMLDSAYKDMYPNKKDFYARNIWDIKEFEGKLYIGAGNSSNIGPAQNAGPLPLISYNPSTKEFKQESIIHDEQIDTIKTFQNKLYIPGHDATQNWDYANIYIKEPNKNLKKYRNIKDGLHVYDIAFYDGKIFAALGTKKGAAVAVSSNDAQNWDIQHLKHYRIYSFLKVGERLFAIKFFPSPKDFQKMSTKRKKEFFSVAEYKKNSFEPRYDLGFKDFFPETKNIDNASKKIIRAIKIDKKSIYIGAFSHNDHQSIPFGVYIAQSTGNELISKRVALPEGEAVWDTLYKDNKVYLLSYNKIKKRITIFLATDNNPDTFKEYISFHSNSFARSFEYINDIFYFSVGSEIKDPKNFTYDEIDKDTGKILIFDTKYLTNQKQG
ncbi:MAG: hypothetical protein AB7D38_00745 [Sulfurimonas sp.]|uniref:hypothetical protein n=1 Tax=Sulfurimonas sp. TaxID=2022749 RepID=UPI003D0EEA74